MVEYFIEQKIKDVMSKAKEEMMNEILEKLSNRRSDKVWMSRREAADYIGVCVSTIDNLVSSGRLEKFKIKSSTRFKRTDLDRLLV